MKTGIKVLILAFLAAAVFISAGCSSNEKLYTRFVTDVSYESEMAKSGLRIVIFYKEDCESCQELLPLYESLAYSYRETDGLRFYKYDAAVSQNVMRTLNIVSVPVILFYKDGARIRKINGFLDTETLSQVIESYK